MKTARDFEREVCRRPGCGHNRHNHQASDNGRCQVKRVSGPAAQGSYVIPMSEDATDEQLHPGRTVTRCPCDGYLS